MEATRQLFWNINGKGFMYIAALAAFLIFFLGISNKVRSWNKGRNGKNGLINASRLKALISHDRNIFKSKLRRFMHMNIFYGFLILLLGTTVIALQEHLNIHLFFGWFYLILSLLMDLSGLMVLIGILIAAHKRYVNKRDGKNRTTDDAISLALLFVILLTGFILEGLRIFAAGDLWAQWSPVGLTAAILIQISAVSVSFAETAYSFLWYFHMLLSLTFIAYIPYSKLFHMITDPLNILLKSSSAIGTLSPVKPITHKNDKMGAVCLEDFTKKQLLELDACLSCLRCEKHCPAYESGVSFSPRMLVQSLKMNAHHRYSFWGGNNKNFDSNIIGSVISQEAMLSCTSCGLCEEKCPVGIEHISRIVDIRRGFMSEANEYPSEVKSLFNNLCTEGNPWGALNNTGYSVAPDISDKKSTDILYWTGCFGRFDSRNIQVSQAMFTIFRKTGIDFAVVGEEINCCGDNARRLGNEFLYQQLALENIKILNKYKFNTIITACPHCFNTLKNEYPELGGIYPVMHHSEFILQLIESGKIKPGTFEKRRITFHDPCYLGRYNDIYTAPRKVITLISGSELAEMRNSKSKSYCCGAGGGRIWVESPNNKKVSTIRAKEAIKIKPDIIASACPLCLVQLTDAVSMLEPGIKNMDIAEIVQENL